jgi:hypothetical protein
MPVKAGHVCAFRVVCVVHDMGWESAHHLPTRSCRAASYSLIRQGSTVGFRCSCCTLTSWNANDVEKRFCGHCRVFHDAA